MNSRPAGKGGEEKEKKKKETDVEAADSSK